MDEYNLKWILLESKIQYNQEKVETKETNKKIKELEYNIKYYKQYLNDIQYLTCVWNTEENKIKKLLNKSISDLNYFKQAKINILSNLRKSNNYGLSNKIII